MGIFDKIGDFVKHTGQDITDGWNTGLDYVENRVIQDNIDRVNENVFDPVKKITQETIDKGSTIVQEIDEDLNQVKDNIQNELSDLIDPNDPTNIGKFYDRLVKKYNWEDNPIGYIGKIERGLSDFIKNSSEGVFNFFKNFGKYAWIALIIVIVLILK